MSKLILKLKQAKRALTKIQKQLEFYACDDNWISGRDNDYICDRIFEDNESQYDYSVGGYRAREALAKLKETEK